MNAPAPAWYNAERVAVKGSVVLQNWMAERERQRSETALVENSSQVYPSSAGTKDSQLYEWLAGYGAISNAGPAVTERTAMGIGAVYACIGLIGGAIAAMPLPIYRRTQAGRERVDHDLWWLLNEQPCPCMSAAVMWEYIIWSLLLHGDAFAIIRRASPMSPKIVGIEPVHPLSVSVREVDDRLIYTVADIDDTGVYDQDDMLHIPGLGFDGLRGLSPLRYAARQTFGIALAADDYSARFFSNGARPDYVVTLKSKMDKEAAQLFRETWMARYSGNKNAHVPAILNGDGADVKALNMSPEEAQLLATRSFQAADVARIFGVPPSMIGLSEKMAGWSGSSVEQQSIGFVKYTLQRHLVKIEQEINRKVFRRSLQLFTEFNTAGLERGDYKARNEGYRIALGRPGEAGWMTVNEIRRLDNLPPIEGGDELSKFAPAVPPAPTPEPAADPVTEPKEPTDPADNLAVRMIANLGELAAHVGTLANREPPAPVTQITLGNVDVHAHVHEAKVTKTTPVRDERGVILHSVTERIGDDAPGTE
jgi:HK97 family phage portal protein